MKAGGVPVNRWDAGLGVLWGRVNGEITALQEGGEHSGLLWIGEGGGNTRVMHVKDGNNPRYSHNYARGGQFSDAIRLFPFLGINGQ